MTRVKQKTLAVVAGSLLVVGLLGASLGIAVAGQPLGAGFNIVGGPRDEMQPATFLSCLPATSWNAVYVWKADKQEWEHFFNTGKGYPAYINLASAGGIQTIPKLSGVVIMMADAQANATLKRGRFRCCRLSTPAVRATP
jgi:hypothetical protein